LIFIDDLAAPNLSSDVFPIAEKQDEGFV